MKTTNSPFTSKKKKKPTQNNASFFEAFKSIGQSTADSLKNDLIKNTATDVLETFATGQNPNTSLDVSHNGSPEWSKPVESNTHSEAIKVQRHNEIISTPIYDRRKEEIKKQIEAIREELKLLAIELKTMSSSTHKALEEEIADPGTYHMSFFEALRKIIIILRKQASEANNWLMISQSRNAAKKKGFWGKVKSHGTKFMLSQERTLATQAG